MNFDEVEFRRTWKTRLARHTARTVCALAGLWFMLHTMLTGHNWGWDGWGPAFAHAVVLYVLVKGCEWAASKHWDER